MGLRALLVGINEYADKPLKGCVNDARWMHGFLTSGHGAGAEQIRLRTDGQATRAEIIAGLEWLAAPDDGPGPNIRLFHYAGHGIQQADVDGDEPDGADECLVPFDHAAAGALPDDILRGLYAKFPADTTLLLLMDCCHSGTIGKQIITDPDVVGTDRTPRTLRATDDEYKRIANARAGFRRGQIDQIVGKLETIANRGASTAELEKLAADLLKSAQKQAFGKAESQDHVVLLSACRPEQVAADARFGADYHGAFTFFLGLALRQNAGVTYEDLAEILRRQMYDNKFPQVPQLECHPNNLKRPFFS